MSLSRISPGRFVASKAVGAVWWYFLLRGLLVLVTGIFVLIKPEQSAIFFAKLVGALVLLDGILAAAAGLMGRAESRVWSLARGVIMTLLGIFVLMKPELVVSLTMKTVFFIIGPIVIIGGIIEIATARRTRREMSGGDASILGGVVTAGFGLLLILAPLFFGLLLIRLLAAGAIIFSLGLLFLARKYRKLAKRSARAAS